MNTTTLFDLNQTASAAAAAALGKDAYATENLKLEAFNAAGHDRLDFPQWSALFQQHSDHFASLKWQPSAAAVAAKAAGGR